MEARNIHQRIAAVMAEVTYIQKERKSGMQYTIVSHDAVTAKCRPALLKAGVVYYPIRCDTAQNGNRTECNMTVRFANIDNPQDFIDVQTCGYGIDSQDKGPGKAQSYAVKYALLKTLGLETGDDADHDSVDHSRDDPAKTPPESGPRQIANNMITAMENARAYANWNAITTDAKFKADLAKLEADAPPMAAEVRKAIGDAKMRIDPAGQAA